MSEPNQTGLSDNAAGAIAYITFVPAIVFLVLPPYNTSPFVRFHAWQSIFLNLASIVLAIALSFFTVFSLMFGAFFFLLVTRLKILPPLTNVTLESSTINAAALPITWNFTISAQIKAPGAGVTP